MKTKKAILTLFFTMIFSMALFAQDRNDLKGPAAKNFNVWESVKAPKPLKSHVAAEFAVFPAQKNRIALASTVGDLEVNTRKERVKRKGLRSKNRNPWSK